MSTDPQSDPNYILQELENAKQVYGGGNYAAAEPMLRDVFEKLQFDPDGMSYCAESLSEIYTAWGKFSEAIKLNQRFINLTASLSNHNVVAIGAALERIAAVSLKVGKQEQSEKLNRLAASVKAGKVDVTTLVTDKGKVPNAPPTTEHTYTFRAISPDSPPPPGMEAPNSSSPQGQSSSPPAARPAGAPDLLAKPIKETAMFSKPNLPAQTEIGALAAPNMVPTPVPTQPASSAPLPTPAPTPPAPVSPSPTPVPPVAPQAAPVSPPAPSPFSAPPSVPAAPTTGAPPPPPPPPPADPLARPTKETAMFSRPTLPPTGAIPVQNLSNEKMGDVADFADFDEEIPVDASSISGSHAPVTVTPPESPAEAPQATAAETFAASQPQAEPLTVDDWGPMENEEWGPPAEQSDAWGPQEPADIPASVSEFQQPDSIPQGAPDSQSGVFPQSPAFSQSAEQPTLAGGEFHNPPFGDSQTSESGQSVSPAQNAAPSFIPPVQLEASPAQFETAHSSSEGVESLGGSEELNTHDIQKASSSAHSASSARSIRSMSSRNMSAPVASGPDMGGLMGMIASLFVGKRDPDAPVQQLVDPSTTSARAAGVLVVMAAAVIGSVFCLYNFIPRKLTPDEAFRAMQHKYISVDSSKTFNLLDESTCEFAVGENKLKARLKFYLDDWRDAVDLSLGKAGQRQFWMYKTDDGLVDENDSKLYLHGGPEIQIANKLDIVGQYAALVYTRTKKYPASGDLIGGAADLHYLNPFSKKKEVPSFHSIVVGKGITVSLDADHARTKFYDELLAGEIPKDTPKTHPGEIRCYAVDFLSPRGTIQAFIVQLIGKDGKPITSAKARTSYLYALEDGKEYKAVGPPTLPYNGEQGIRPTVVWLLMDKLDSNFVLLLTMAPVVIFTILSFIFLVMSFLIPRGLGRAVAVVLLAACAIPALAFCFVKFMP